MGPTRWQKSSFCGTGENNSCIELAAAGTEPVLRESDDPGVVVRPGTAALAAFVRAAKSDAFGRRVC
ncbi:hypothetical protein GCM10010218_27430 [Streptomyces mashuensis]|uniref:DUF397 domain-containing protein n=1 Tax=Streptomyces mashuensis TaxID=33904 RepID=A0A919B406_9ACTN|nr:DUF397 domain-containing protein [Streptomyces mashuensis]GHF44548.1 hypothetical protein GCM10010218_27430 [Streptomyces mashuensis]